MSIEQLLIDYNIRYITSGHKHCSQGWVNMPCPFCTGNPGYHLGFEINSGRSVCRRCGWKPTEVALSKLIGINTSDARRLLSRYRIIRTEFHRDVPVKLNPFKYPSGITELQTPHIRYLERRKFNPIKLKRLWNIQATGPVSILDGINYKHRIIAPIYWDGQIVSFQSRDITDKSQVKYLTCPKSREKIHHKNILYGRQDKWSGTGICVEGIFDVWRLGYPAFATFGIEYKIKQLIQMCKHFRRVILLYDHEEKAQKQAQEIIARLKMEHVETFIETIENDPGSLDQQDANWIVKKWY